MQEFLNKKAHKVDRINISTTDAMKRNFKTLPNFLGHSFLLIQGARLNMVTYYQARPWGRAARATTLGP